MNDTEIPTSEPAPVAAAETREEAAPAAAAPPAPAPEAKPQTENRPQQEQRGRPGGERGDREQRGPRPGNEARGPKPNDRNARAEERKGDDRRSGGGERGGDRERGGRDDRSRERGGRFDGPPEIDIEKLISDSLYLDNQAHAVVAGMRDMDSGTRSQLRRLYSAIRRACRAPETDRQHQFVMLRARLAYTIARHSLRRLDPLERLLLQVTRKNDARGYERFRDLFEAIVAYNE